MTMAEGASQETSEAAVRRTQDLCERIFAELARWFGVEGSKALFIRALAQARAEEPLLENIQIPAQKGSTLSGIDDAVNVHGPQATVVALESVIRALLSLLEKLIGGDMAIQVMTLAAREQEIDSHNFITRETAE